MPFLAAGLQPPAYSLKNRLKSVKLAVLTALFGCQHPNPSIPIGNIQECPDCGAVRDYIFTLTWRDEYKDILGQWQDGQLTPTQFARYFHERLEKAHAAFIGEWRRPSSWCIVNSLDPRPEPGPVSVCDECGSELFLSGKCPTGGAIDHMRRAQQLALIGGE